MQLPGNVHWSFAVARLEYRGAAGQIRTGMVNANEQLKFPPIRFVARAADVLLADPRRRGSAILRLPVKQVIA